MIRRLHLVFGRDHMEPCDARDLKDSRAGATLCNDREAVDHATAGQIG